MNGLTICTCGHRVCTAPGFCMICGAVFSTTTILRQVAPREKQHILEMEYEARVRGGLMPASCPKKAVLPASVRVSLLAA